MNVKPMLSLAAACCVCLPVGAMAQPAASKEKKTEAANSEVTGTATDVTVAYEAFSMEAAKAIALRREHATDAALYTALIASVEKGDAVQETLAAVRGAAGKTLNVRSVSELIYPTQWEEIELPIKPVPDPASTVFAFPCAYETRHIGFDLQVGVEVDGSTINLRLTPEHTGFTERSAWGENNWAVEMPEISHQRTVSQVLLRDKQPFFLGTLNPQKLSERSPERMWFAFVASSVRKLETTQKPAAGDPFKAEPSGKDEPPLSYSLTYEAFSLPLKDAAVLRRQDLGEADLHKQLVARVAQGAAKQEAFTVIRGLPGMRVVSENGPEHISPTEYNPPIIPTDDPEAFRKTPTRLPYIPTAFETRNCGTDLTIEISGAEDSGWVRLQAEISNVTLGEKVKWGKEIAQTEHPVYDSQLLKTSVTTLLGSPCFLGTLNPPDPLKPEAKSDKRVWFAFITPDLAK